MYGETQTKNLQSILNRFKLDGLFLLNRTSPLFDPLLYYFTGITNIENAVAFIQDKPRVWVPGFEVERVEK